MSELIYHISHTIDTTLHICKYIHSPVNYMFDISDISHYLIYSPIDIEHWEARDAAVEHRSPSTVCHLVPSWWWRWWWWQDGERDGGGEVNYKDDNCVDDNDDADNNDANLSLWSNGGREGGGDLQHVLHHVLVHLQGHHGDWWWIWWWWRIWWVYWSAWR